MDIFEDQVDPPGSDPVHQIHDFNPGTRESGLFWTRRIRARGVRGDPESRQAELRVLVRRIGDYGNVVRALMGEDPIAIGSVAYRVRWQGGGDPIPISDGETFKAIVVEDKAALDWVAREPGFRFKSTGTTKQNFAEIGLEVNGEFFAAGEEAADEAVDDTDEADDDGAAEVATDGDLE